MRNWLFIILVFTSGNLLAQDHHEELEHRTHHVDVENLKDFLGKGEAHGFVRYSFMSTWHPRFNHDYFANALGGNLGYYTPSYKGFSFGISGLFVHNIYSTPVEVTEESHESAERWYGRLSPYELQLFDINHPEKKDDLDRLEELFLLYQHKNMAFKIGKMDVESPLINRTDTRMKPYVVRGALFQTDFKKYNSKLTVSWFDKASPRSTTHWFYMNDAVGIYWQGYTTDGEAYHYAGELQTAGIGMAGYEATIKAFDISVWDYYFENISNTVFVEVEREVELEKPHHELQFGVQYVHQDAVNRGGNSEKIHSYMDAGESSNVLSGKAGVKTEHWLFSGNYSWITADGRFLFPQELGRENFYTSMPRARLEGLGKTHSAVLKAEWKPTFAKHMTSTMMAGRNWLPAWDDYQFNKYQKQSYDHVALDFKYQFIGFLEGLTVDLFYVYQDTQWLNDPVAENEEVNFQLHHINLVANVKF